MADKPITQVPTLPETANSTGQQVSTVTSAPPSRQLIEGQIVAEGDLPASLRGLAASNDRLVFNEAGSVVLAAATGMLAAGEKAARQEAKELRQELNTLHQQHSDERVAHATSETELRAERGAGALRLLFGNLGAVLLGLIPFADEKAKIPGVLLCAIVGTLLVAGAWIHTWRSSARTPSGSSKP
jgi:hypothetical protein